MSAHTDEIMALADAYADAALEQGLHQVFDTPIPEQKREILRAAIAALEADIVQPAAPIAYLKFWAYQQVSADGDVNADEGFEACLKDEIGIDGTPAFAVYAAPQAAAINAELLEALQKVMTWIDNWEPEFTNDPEWDDDESDARAAIAKATGGAA